MSWLPQQVPPESIWFHVRQGLIKALCHLVCEEKKGSCGGVVWAETALCWG